MTKIWANENTAEFDRRTLDWKERDHMKTAIKGAIGTFLATLLVLLGQGSPATASNQNELAGNDIVANQLIVQLENGTIPDRLLGQPGVLSGVPIGLSGNLTYLVDLDPFLPLTSHLSRLDSLDFVEYAEPNYVLQLEATSDDTNYISGELWNMNGPASSPVSAYGVNASAAWGDGYTGSRKVYVAVIDSGINVDHPDLAANIWTNLGEIPGDGIDNDGNGFIDDVHGYDFLNGDSTVYDSGENPHGTHVAGTIGAVGGNATGVVGVNWQVSLISAKIVDEAGKASVASAISAIDYITMLRMKKGLDIIASNNSWGGTAYSRSLEDAIKRGGDVGIIFVAAAGNEGQNLDSAPQYPAAYDCTTPHRPFDCVVSVGATDESGQLAGYSNSSATLVDLAAPGTNILSTAGSDYETLSGTSMATPHVTGAIALCVASYRGTTSEQAIAKLLGTTRSLPSLSGKVATGGILNVADYVDSCVSGTTGMSSKLSNSKLSALYTDRARMDWDDTAIGDYEQEIQLAVGPDGCRGTFQHFGFIGPGLTALPIFNLEEAQFYCFRVRAIRDSSVTAWSTSNVAITWTSNLPFIFGKVTLADGVTPVSKAPVKWLATGAYGGLENANAVTGYTNVSGEYVLQVPNGTEGELFVNTSRFANRGLDTEPQTPWGLEAGGKITVSQDTTVNISLPAQKIVTVTVRNAETNAIVPGATVEFSGYSKACLGGSYTPFSGAVASRCLSWPGGYAHSGPVADANGQIQLALLDSQHVSDADYEFLVHDPSDPAKITNFTLNPTGPATATVLLNPAVEVTGHVYLSNGITPVVGAPVKWLNDGQYAGLENKNAVTTTTDSDGAYSLAIPSGSYGKLFVNTSRYPSKVAPTSPQLPWGLEAGGMTTITENKVIDLVMPAQNIITFRVSDFASGAGVVGASVEFSGYSKSCKAGTYKAFEGAGSSSCLSWPGGYPHSAPKTNSSGEAKVAFFAPSYVSSNSYSFLVRDPSDTSKTTAVELSPTANTVVEVVLNPPVVVSGRVLMSDGITPVASAPVKWLNDGQYGGLENINALTTTTNSDGEYSLEVPPATLGRLFVNTSRSPVRATPTKPLIPWGLEAGGSVIITENTSIDIRLPKQHLLTINVKEWASEAPVPSATVEFSGYTKACKSGFYTPFAGATKVVCSSWPGGYPHSEPVTNSGGSVDIAVFDHTLVSNNDYHWTISHPFDLARVASLAMTPNSDRSYDVIMPGTPSQPEQPSATALTNEVRLNWTEPWNGGAFIDYYQVWVSLNSDGPFSLVKSGTCTGNIAPDLRTCVVTELDPGVTYYFAIIAHNVVGASDMSISISSTPKAAILDLASTPKPTILGTAQVGKFLSVAAGKWDSGVQFDYQWLRDGSAISGASSSSYLLNSLDAGKAISVRVTGRKVDHHSVTKTSSASVPTWPIGARLVAISGLPALGEMLIASKSPLVAELDTGYQWLRSGVVIDGATAANYEPVPEDVGSTLTVKLTGAVLASAPVTSVMDEVFLAPDASQVLKVKKDALLGATAAPVAKVKYIQTTLPTFRANNVLTGAHRAKIKSILEDSTATKFICTGIRLEGASHYQNVQVRKRAKAACDYAKTLKPSLSTWYQSKPTKARAFSGKVLLGLRG